MWIDVHLVFRRAMLGEEKPMSRLAKQEKQMRTGSWPFDKEMRYGMALKAANLM